MSKQLILPEYEGKYRYVDLIRGIGITLVVIGHTEVPDAIKIIIYSFHMPLFFILAG